jgi:hypothetical protein
MITNKADKKQANKKLRMIKKGKMKHDKNMQIRNKEMKKDLKGKNLT